LEHIPAAQEDRFVGNMAASLNEHGVIVLGMPSIQSQAYASPQSLAGHVNCKDGKGLKETIERFFHNVFIFSMNDEVVHTGFHAMAHYLIDAELAAAGFRKIGRNVKVHDRASLYGLENIALGDNVRIVFFDDTVAT